MPTSDSEDDTFDIHAAFADAPVVRTDVKHKVAQVRVDKGTVKEAKAAKEKRKEKKEKRKRAKEHDASEMEDNADVKDINSNKRSIEDENDEGTSIKPKKKRKVEKPNKERKDGSIETDLNSENVKNTLRSHHGIWVGNLSFTTTTKNLCDFFNGCGEITRVHCPKGENGKNNKGFAYIDFSNPSSVVTAVTLSESELDGRKLLIKDANNFEKTGRPVSAQSLATVSNGSTTRQIYKPSATLFIGNLSFHATKEGLNKQFEEFGKIRKVRLMTFEDSTKCKGFAYIDFYDVQSAVNAINTPSKHFLNNLKLRVQYASPEATLRGTPWVKDQLEKQKLQEQLSTNINRDKASENLVPSETTTSEEKERPKRKFGKTERIKAKEEKGIQAHQKPGATLAYAQRQRPTIQQFLGKKIVFENDD